MGATWAPQIDEAVGGGSPEGHPRRARGRTIIASAASEEIETS